MKSIKMGLKLYKKNLPLNLVATIQIISVLSVLSVMISILSFLNISSERREKLWNEDFVFYDYQSEHETSFFSFDEQINEKINSGDYEIIVPDPVSIDQLSSVSKQLLVHNDTIVTNGADGEEHWISVVGYNDASLEYFPIETKRNAPMPAESDGAVEALVSSGFEGLSAGDTITAAFYKISDDGEATTEEIEIIIIGEVKKNNYCLSYGAGGSIGFSHLLENISEPNGEEPILIFNYDEMEKIGMDASSSSDGDCIFVFDKDADEQAKAKDKELMLRSGELHTAEDFEEDESKDEGYVLEKYMPEFVMLIVLSLSGLIGITVINASRLRPVYDFFFSCGATRKQCALIMFAQVDFCVLTSCVPILVAIGIFDYFGIEIDLLPLINYKVYVSVLCVSAVYIACALATPLSVYFKNTGFRKKRTKRKKRSAE